VSSPAELTKIFDGTLVKQFSRREDGSTFDPAEVEAWEAELVRIKCSSQIAQSTCCFTSDQLRNNTQNRVKSTHARKFAREVKRIHNNGARKPSVVFNAVARAIFYKGCDENDDDSSLTNSIHMHSDRVFASGEGARAIVSVSSAKAEAQAAENGDATDEVRALSVKSTCYIKGRLYRVIKGQLFRACWPWSWPRYWPWLLLFSSARSLSCSLLGSLT
jgi:hypothetical protein